MDHLLNILAVHHSRAFRDLKKERPDQADLLLGKHHPGETVTAQKQATGSYQKNSEHLLAICSLSGPGENYEHKKHTLFHIPCLIDNREQKLGDAAQKHDRYFSVYCWLLQRIAAIIVAGTAHQGQNLGKFVIARAYTGKAEPPC